MDGTQLVCVALATSCCLLLALLHPVTATVYTQALVSPCALILQEMEHLADIDGFEAFFGGKWPTFEYANDSVSIYLGFNRIE